MKYYATVYLTDGTIHLKPYDTKEGAERCINAIIEKLGEKVEYTRIIKKDLTKDSYIAMKGHWII